MTGLGESAVLDAWTAARHDDRAARIDRLGRLTLGAAAAQTRWDDATRAFLELAARSGPLEVVADCPACATPVEANVPVGVLASVRDSGHELADDGPARPPSVGDMVAVAHLSAGGAADALVARCGLDSLDETERAHTLARWDEQHALLAPSLGVDCPACGTAVELPIDAVALAWSAIGDLAGAVVDDVVALATRFGWTEADVLALPPARRRWYRELIDGADPRG